MTLRGTTLPEIMSSWSDATQILKVINDPTVLLAIVTLLQAGSWGFWLRSSHPGLLLSFSYERILHCYQEKQRCLHLSTGEAAFWICAFQTAFYSVFAPSQEYELTFNQKLEPFANKDRATQQKKKNRGGGMKSRIMIQHLVCFKMFEKSITKTFIRSLQLS